MNRGKNSPTFLDTKQSQIKICVLFFFSGSQTFASPILFSVGILNGLLHSPPCFKSFYLSKPYSWISLNITPLLYPKSPIAFTFNCRRVDGRNLRLGPAYFVSICSFTEPSTEPLAEEIPRNYCLNSSING